MFNRECKMLRSPMNSKIRYPFFRKKIFWITDNITDNLVSPENFLKFVIDDNKNYVNRHLVNEHWRPQTASCPFCLYPFRVYGRYETYAEDDAYVLLKSNLTYLSTTRFIHHEKYHGKLSRRQTFWSQVPALYLQDIKDIFKTDFYLFDYAWDMYHQTTRTHITLLDKFCIYNH